MYGGRIAEELVFGKDNVTTGAGNDIQQATGLARRMVTEFGFSDKLGPLRYSDNEEEIFLGHSVTQRQNMSDQTADLIDTEVRRLIEEAEASATKILTDRREHLEIIANSLLEYESLSGGEVEKLLRGEDISRSSQEEKTNGSTRKSSVPSAGQKSRENDSSSGMEPEPQPGS